MGNRIRVCLGKAGVSMLKESREASINWRSGLLRAWVLASVIWAIGWGLLLLPNTGQRIAIARMTDIELISSYFAECKLPLGTPPPRTVDWDCMKRLDQDGRGAVEGWGGGDGYFEQALRVTRALAPELALLILPPLCILLFGAALGWVLRGFAKA
jgi:hypothetical protein